MQDSSAEDRNKETYQLVKVLLSIRDWDNADVNR